MSKLAFPLSLSALALLAACATSDPVTPAPAPVVVVSPPVVTAPPAGTVAVPPGASAPVVVPAPAAVRPGFGRIESIAVSPTSAAAGATTKPMRRLGIKMEDGTLQYVDTTAEGLSVGERVELTRDGYIRHPA